MQKPVPPRSVNFFLILFAILALAGFVLYFQKPTRQVERVPGFTLQKFDGTIIRSENLHGRPIVMNFWASWCEPCRWEMPGIEKVYQEYKDKGLVVLGVHRTETENKEVGEKFAKSLGITYELVSDPKNRLFDYFGGGSQVIPITVFINREGFVEVKVIGPRSEPEFRALVEKIIK